MSNKDVTWIKTHLILAAEVSFGVAESCCSELRYVAGAAVQAEAEPYDE